MMTIYKTNKQLQAYCKRLETLTLNRAGIAPAFTTIADRLLKKACISVEYGNTYILDAEKFKTAKRETREYLKKHYPDKRIDRIIEYELSPGNWVPVLPSELTDDEESLISLQNESPEILNGSEWYLDRNYCFPPRPIRIKEVS